MPLPDAEHNSWRTSALALRWAKPAIRRLDWELWPGAFGLLTAMPTYAYHALTYQKTDEGDRVGLAPPVSFVRNEGALKLRWPRSHWPPTSPPNECFRSIRPTDTSAKNWNRTLVANDWRCDSRLQFEWIVSGLTACVSGPRRGVRSRRW